MRELEHKEQWRWLPFLVFCLNHHTSYTQWLGLNSHNVRTRVKLSCLTKLLLKHCHKFRNEFCFLLKFEWFLSLGYVKLVRFVLFQ